MYKQNPRHLPPLALPLYARMAKILPYLQKSKKLTGAHALLKSHC